MTAVNFFSSRGEAAESVPFREALIAGLAPGGGLYLPDRIPPLPSGWERFESFPELATAVLGQWLAEPCGSELSGLLAEALDFPVPIRALSDDRFIVELFHGPTLSFKDFGARTMARLLDYYLRHGDEKVTILVATSGDTGSAVADGFAGLENVRVVLLYPRGMVSEVQEQQLTVPRKGVRSLRVGGTFDDCQRLVKAALDSRELAAVNLSSANSINIGRLLPQQLYYIWAVAQFRRLVDADSEPLFSVPSGNLGNLTAGMIAADSGLPVGRFLAGHNANDYFPRFLAGEAAEFDFGETKATISNAMDVGAPSNFERLQRLFGSELGGRVSAVSVDDSATRERMRATYTSDDYIACPHTAVGLEAVARYRSASGDDRPALVLATAHPAKFPVIVQKAIGKPPPSSAQLEWLLSSPTRVTEIAAAEQELREVLLEPF